MSTHSKCHKTGYNDDDTFLDTMDNCQPMSKYVAKITILLMIMNVRLVKHDIPSNFHPIICFNM